MFVWCDVMRGVGFFVCCCVCRKAFIVLLYSKSYDGGG